jgi:transcriptional regulator with PAS, ATPase and Fis domain
VNPRIAASASSSVSTFHGLVGRSKAIQEILARIEKVTASDANVCIFGESGTGKELIARAIHARSPRRDRPLVTFDCTTVPEGLLESHLFGHVRGAFTGAVDHREGVFARAHTGTLFIDELSELSPPLQAKLLRVIQAREFVKVGGTETRRVDIRLITATNKNPKRGVELGTFREDLYYRVAVVVIRVPPLRERPDDIPLLVEHFLTRFSRLHNRRKLIVPPRVMDQLSSLRWPGNIRQLENFIEQAVVLADGDTLHELDLPADDAPWPDGPRPGPLGFEPELTLHEVERRHILDTLLKADSNRTRAAKLLGISVRCLQYRLKHYAMEGSSSPPVDEFDSSVDPLSSNGGPR